MRARARPTTSVAGPAACGTPPAVLVPRGLGAVARHVASSGDAERPAGRDLPSGVTRHRGGGTTSSRKIQPLASLVRVVRRARARGRRVVFTNGCFDLLHAGHVDLLERARRHGDLLVVGLNSDRSVRAIKGAGRPVMREQDRALVLAGLASVDYVTIFDEATPERLVSRLRPDVLIKGADWAATRIVGGDTVRRSGGRVIRLAMLKGRSSSRLIERIRRSLR